MTLRKADNITLPQPPEIHDSNEMNIYAKFMRHLRCVPNSRMDIKILSAIQFSADMLDYSDAHMAKVLVDMGLRAPRMAFPAEFLTFADRALMRSGWDVGGPSQSLYVLEGYWNTCGDGRFKDFQYEYMSSREEKMLV